jgi:hypothetical protein
MDIDRYPDLGERILVSNLETALAAVRALYPDATMQGSTGFERSFVRETDRGQELVGHCWPKSKSWKTEDMFLRILAPGREGPVS